MLLKGKKGFSHFSWFIIFVILLASFSIFSATLLQLSYICVLFIPFTFNQIQINYNHRTCNWSLSYFDAILVNLIVVSIYVGKFTKKIEIHGLHMYPMLILLMCGLLNWWKWLSYAVNSINHAITFSKLTPLYFTISLTWDS